MLFYIIVKFKFEIAISKEHSKEIKQIQISFINYKLKIKKILPILLLSMKLKLKLHNIYISITYEKKMRCHTELKK